MSFPVKPEPGESRIPPADPPINRLPVNVKSESSDPAPGFLGYLPQNILSLGSRNLKNVPSSGFAGTVAKQEPQESRHPQPELIAEPIPKFFTSYSSAADISYLPENALKEGLGMTKTIKEGLKKLELGSKLRQEVWDREIANLEGQGSPRTLVAVCGATGAGKSSILNAILDDNIVPTSGMRACTAVVTEISYHKKSSIDAEISFLSEIEWRQELEVLLHDLVDEDGKIKRITDLKSDAGVAWQKVHAVYPTIKQDVLVKMDVNTIMLYDISISHILGTTKKISAKDSKGFAKEIGKYIDSKDQKRGKKDKKDKKDKVKELSIMDKVRKSAGMTSTSSSSKKEPDAESPALWPLIRQVNVQCKAACLSTGAVLVDLPGVADANAARNNIAKDYMKKCNCIWILAPITRAVDDKTARDLLGDAFKMQLMNGNYDDHAITFIASKCDDISCSEVIRSLRLDDEPELEGIEGRLHQIRADTSKCKKQKIAADKVVKDIESSLKEVCEQLREDKAHLEALENGDIFEPVSKKKPAPNSKKRKSSSGGKRGSPKRRRSSGIVEDEISLSDDDSKSDSSSDNSDSDDASDVSSDESHSEVEATDYSEGGGSSESENSEDELDEDGDEDMDETTQESLKIMIADGTASIKALHEQLNKARASKKAASDSLSSLAKSGTKAQREKNAFCSLKRSEFSRDVLKEDFRVGLKDLDDAAAEERDPHNFNPTANLRDYDAIDLPVFTCSSRDYVRLKGQVKGDGSPTCFSNINDTGIPELQKWCHQLTIASRERSARLFMAHIKTFAQSVQSYVQGIGDVTAIDRELLREKWESRGFDEPAQQGSNYNDFNGILESLGEGIGFGLHSMNRPAPKVDPYGQPTGITPRLCSDFAKIVDGCVRDLQQHFKDGLEEKCRVGALLAAQAALPTVDELVGSMHWMSYRATLRRHGSWRRDMNAELTHPFTRNIAHSWSQVFESDLFGDFQTSTITVITDLVKEVEETAASGLKERAKLQGEMCKEEARVALAKSVELVRETMNKEQKEVSRCMAPHVQSQLVDGYDEAMLERGTGSVARQKAVFRRYVENCKDDIFEDGATVVLDLLTKVAEAIGHTLDDAMSKLAQKIEVSLAVLWEGAHDNPAQLRARKGVVDAVEIIQNQVKFWTEAGQMKHKEVAKTPDSDAMEED